MDIVYNNTTITIAQLPRIWNVHPDLILKDNILSKDVVGITYQQYLNGELDDMMEKYKQDIKILLKEQQDSPGYTWEDLPDLKRPKADFIESVMEADVPIKEIKTYKKPINLKKILKELEKGKIIDVSTMNEAGVGRKKVDYKHQDKFVTKNKKLMSSQYLGMINALTILTNQGEDYEKEIERAKRYFKK